jgi:hypothetical protein
MMQKSQFIRPHNIITLVDWLDSNKQCHVCDGDDVNHHQDNSNDRMWSAIN